MTLGALTQDAFLGGRLVIAQPKDGYRAATDPVLLAAAVEARAGQSVLELGLGVGVAALALAVRVPGLSVTGVEVQAGYAALARENAAAAGVALEVVEADVAGLPEAVRQRSFDHVITNPPFFEGMSGTAPGDQGRATAHQESVPLGDWLEVGLRRVVPGGWLTVIQRAERLGEMLAALEGAGGIELLPIAAREGREAKRVLLRLKKGGRAPLRLLAPLVMHDGSQHGADGDDYSARATGILRHCRSIEW